MKLLKDGFTEDMKLEFAVGIAKRFKDFHSLPVPEQNGCGPFQQDHFANFIKHRMKICLEKHKKWKHLSPRLLEQLPSYLASSADDLLKGPMRLIHGDMHHEV